MHARQPLWTVTRRLVAAGCLGGIVLVAARAEARQPASATTASTRSCDALTALRLEDTTIVSAHVVAAGEFVPPAGGGRVESAGLPAFCRIAAVTRPAIRFEVWLPIDTWNGKFQGVGNGANAGSIGYGAMAAALKRGYATASTDTATLLKCEHNPRVTRSVLRLFIEPPLFCLLMIERA